MVKLTFLKVEEPGWSSRRFRGCQSKAHSQCTTVRRTLTYRTRKSFGWFCQHHRIWITISARTQLRTVVVRGWKSHLTGSGRKRYNNCGTLRHRCYTNATRKSRQPRKLRSVPRNRKPETTRWGTSRYERKNINNYGGKQSREKIPRKGAVRQRGWQRKWPVAANATCRTDI